MDQMRSLVFYHGFEHARLGWDPYPFNQSWREDPKKMKEYEEGYLEGMRVYPR